MLGATVPLLVAEAWLTARRYWRVRLLNTLAFAAPLGAQLSFGAAYSFLSFHHTSVQEKELANLEFMADFLYFSAYATLPVFALLVLVWRRSRSARESAAYASTTGTALLATLSYAVVFAGFLHVLTYLMGFDTAAPQMPAAIH